MSKIVFGWVVNWGEVTNSPNPKEPNVTCDLFFSSREKFESLVGLNEEYARKQILVPIKVPDNFNDIDYIPDNY